MQGKGERKIGALRMQGGELDEQKPLQLKEIVRSS